MSAHVPRIGLVSVPPSSPAGAPAIGQLATLVSEMVLQLEHAPDAPKLHRMAVACNALLEDCLEAQRTDRDEDREPSPRDELARLGHMLTVVDRRAAVSVMRQLRRVLARFDVRRT